MGWKFASVCGHSFKFKTKSIYFLLNIAVWANVPMNEGNWT